MNAGNESRLRSRQNDRTKARAFLTAVCSPPTATLADWSTGTRWRAAFEKPRARSTVVQTTTRWRGKGLEK
jgi:hypothetical protein